MRKRTALMIGNNMSCESVPLIISTESLSRTLEQRTNLEGYPEAGELIEMTGLEDLEASQRAISNLLCQHAHDSGRFTEPDALFEIPMATLRRALSKHESGDRLREGLVALMRVVVRGRLCGRGRGATDYNRRAVQVL
jgi:hypothetical protein